MAGVAVPVVRIGLGVAMMAGGNAELVERVMRVGFAFGSLAPQRRIKRQQRQRGGRLAKSA